MVRSLNGPVLKLTKEEIAKMDPNKPTPPRRFGTDASLDWPEQLETIKRACSKAVTRLAAMLDGAAEGQEIGDIVLALQRTQAIAIKSMGGEGAGEEPTDAELLRHTKK